MKEDNFQTAGNPLTDGCVGSFGISEDNITGRGNTHTHTHTHTQYPPNLNSQWRSSPDAHICQQCAGAEQEVTDCTA